MNYRPEIDGLRAVAVIPVVIYHLNPLLLQGGFVGVDVFFVISGFLITSIILREHDKGTFTLRNFWMRRIRRLFPALAVVLLATLLAGSLILYPDEWRDLGSQVASVLALIANVYLLTATGDYWGTAAESLPLLHTWSLAVEEQFYLIFPILLLCLLRLRRSLLIPILAAGFVLSFAHGINETSTQPAKAFFLLPSRAWELLAGCLLATSSWKTSSAPANRAWCSHLALLGLAAVIGSYFLIDQSAGFPGYQSLLPVLGTVAVIAFSSRDGCLTKRILSLPPVVFVGKISYSLYLWHWPVIVLWRLQTMEPVSTPRHALGIIVVSFTAAALSYRFVERPFRTGGYPLWSRKFAIIGATFAILAVLALSIRQQYLPSFAIPAFSKPEFSFNAYSAKKDEAWKSGGILIGDAPPSVVVLGSSHAMMYAPAIEEIAREKNCAVSFICIAGALGRFHTEGDDSIFRDGIGSYRAEFDQARLSHLKQWKPAAILWFGRWDSQFRNLGAEEFDRIFRENFALLLEHADRVAIFSQVPVSMERPGSIVRYASTLKRKGRAVEGMELSDQTKSRRAANDALRTIAEDFPRVTLIDLAPAFEIGDSKVRILSEEHKLLYRDDDHLSKDGAILVRDLIAPWLGPTAPKPTSPTRP